jgi:hypothetical protein
MAALSGWPSTSDDTGTGQDGTVLNVAFFDAIKASIEGELVSATNPTETAKGIIDEVVDARGSLASLDARLDISLNEDGTLKTQSSLATLAQLQSQMGAVNLVQNDDMLLWHLGDADAPSGWEMSTITCARAGTGLADTNRKIGNYCAKLTRVGADGFMRQYLINSSEMSRADFLEGTVIGAGCWVLCSTPNAARVAVSDGATTTYSDYHTGGGTWEWLSVEHTVSGSATHIEVQCVISNTAADAYFSGFTALMSTVAPTRWQPCPKVYGTLVWRAAGTLSVANEYDRFMAARPLLVKDVVLRVGTAPTGAALQLEVQKWDSSATAWVDMFSTAPEIAAAATNGNAQPDGTYANRCVNGGDGDNGSDEYMRFNITQVGSGTAGADLWVFVRCLQYARPLESLLEHDHWGA